MSVEAEDDRELARDELRRAWRETGWYTDQTVGEALAAGAADHPDGRLVFERVDGGADHLTLADLGAQAATTAARLWALGVRPGDALIVQAAADAVGTEAMVAAWRLGAVVVPLVTTAGEAEIAHAVRETGATTMLVAGVQRDRDLVAAAHANASRWGLENVLAIGSSSGDVPRLADIDVDAGLDVGALVATHRPDPSAVACILYTSGSTGLPKGVQHSHETMLAGSAFAATVTSPTGPALTAFPAGHVASVLGLLRPLTTGGTTIVLDRWSARRATELIEQYGVFSTAGTPFYLLTLLDEADRSGRDISSLRLFLCGAAPVPPALVARAEARGIISWRTYGSTEHPAISSGMPTDPPDKRRLTDGRVGPGNEVRVVDALGADVEPGAEGEIVSRGPRQFIGYRDATLDDAAFSGSWFRTGDLGQFDPDGYLVITDRVKDIIIRGGENISAREVEDLLAEHPDIAEVAVVPAPHAVFGEEVCAVVRVRPGRAVEVAALAAFARDRGLATHKHPTRLVLVDDFPRTASGKVRKRDLRTLL